jgi:aromatic ring-opening dioxygenase LigB subunit
VANPFVFACITPHGLPIIEELSKDNVSLMMKTRQSMRQIGLSMAKAKPETIVLITPHGLRVDGQFSISASSFMSGQLSLQTVAAMSGVFQMDTSSPTVDLKRAVDRDLAKHILQHTTAAGLPVASLNFATNEGYFSTLPLDWGCIVPLYFMPDVPIVVITPSRRLSYEDHIRFGEALAEAVRQSNKRVGFIASCDWAHAHDPAGPYGYHEDAPVLDGQVVDILQTDEIEKMQQFDDEFVANAKPDGIWQALILAGAIPRADRKSTFLSYEVPTYFGLMCVAYH